MQALPLLAQTGGTAQQDWWWSALTSRPALVLIAVALGCMLVGLYLLWRLSRVAEEQREQSVRQRLAGDSGVAMIEFVLVTPIILFLTLLLIQTALVFTGLFYVHYASFAAARSAIVYIPMDYLDDGEPANYISTDSGSEKFGSIEAAAQLALVPVCGEEDGAGVAGAEMAGGIEAAYSSQGKEVPNWVENLLEGRIAYAMNHTRVKLYTVRPGVGSSTVVFKEISSSGAAVKVSPKEAIAAKVEHEMALTVPLASAVFAAAGGDSGSYSPMSGDGESPPPPGEWTLLKARSILTNEGIIRDLPEEPPVPRYR